MAVIRKLPSAVVAVVSQIAAGEVIERPASALKELLENSRDGAAKKIEIDIIEGGIRRLAVKDDGCGIGKEDLPLAVSPHATSKIEALSDLDDLSTMGFRGEALASIAAVASLTVRSRSADDANGHELALRGEYGSEEPRPVPMACGTEVIVEDLFAQVPARRKFLRRPPTEWAHCESVASAFALSAPEIDITLSRDGKPRRRWRRASASERVKSVYGPRFAEQAKSSEFSLGPLHAQVLIATGLPAAGRNKVILNGRVLNDRLLRQAVRKGAADVSRESEPAYAIFLTLPAQFADVNAHPAKTEVRFREPQAIFKFVMDAVAAAVATPLGPPRRLVVTG
ncbi:MAG: DNA mismatch repair endonuclease MutL, partial [Betaproteobacteria bacterium]|nr:DNA mismatch repair endonuclease MutL [Betaproteobacteria bacterium]